MMKKAKYFSAVCCFVLGLLFFTAMVRGADDEVSAVDAVAAEDRQCAYKPMIGDRRLGWSIQRPPGLEIISRSPDGKRSIFLVTENAVLAVEYFENTFAYTMDVIRLVEMDKATIHTPMGHSLLETESGTAFVATQFRGHALFQERRVFLPGNHIVVVSMTIHNSVTVAERNNYLAWLDTFYFVFDTETAEDLSDVVEEMRLFIEPYMQLRFRMPIDWIVRSNTAQINNFTFGQPLAERTFTGEGARLEIFSLSEDDCAKTWATEERERKIQMRNANIFTFSPLQNKELNGVPSVYFLIEGRLSGMETSGISIFWEYGAYMYNLYIVVGHGDYALIESIITNLSFSEIDYDTVGFLFRPPVVLYEDTVVRNVRNTQMGFSMDVPATWAGRSENSFFSDNRKNLSVLVERFDFVLGFLEISAIMNNLAAYHEYTIVQTVRQVVIPSPGTVNVFTFELKGYMYDDGALYYIKYFVINGWNRSYILYGIIPQHYNSAVNRETFLQMVRSFTII